MRKYALLICSGCIVPTSSWHMPLGQITVCSAIEVNVLVQSRICFEKLAHRSRDVVVSSHYNHMPIQVCTRMTWLLSNLTNTLVAQRSISIKNANRNQISRSLDGTENSQRCFHIALETLLHFVPHDSIGFPICKQIALPSNVPIAKGYFFNTYLK